MIDSRSGAAASGQQIDRLCQQSGSSSEQGGAAPAAEAAAKTAATQMETPEMQATAAGAMRRRRLVLSATDLRSLACRAFVMIRCMRPADRAHPSRSPMASCRREADPGS